MSKNRDIYVIREYLCIKISTLVYHTYLLHKSNLFYAIYYALAPTVGTLSDDRRLTSVCRLHRA